MASSEEVKKDQNGDSMVEEPSPDEKDDLPENDEFDSKNGPKKLILRVIANIAPMVFVASLAYFLANSFLLGERYVKKAEINSEISTLIKNGAGLRAVKFHYDHRGSIKRDIFFSIKHDLSLYYKYEVALSEVLETLRTEQFLGGDPDEDFLKKLNSIIREYTESNPFDKLEAGQKDLFENIRVKLNGSYAVISDDINKLSDELDNKNKLVNEYLSDSQTSLVVSIVSAFIAVILAAIQMWQNRSKPMSWSASPYANYRKETVFKKDNGDRIRTIRYPDGRVIKRVYTKSGEVINKDSKYI